MRGTWAPVAIGGIGGSGTRVVAAVAAGAGLALGDDLNGALDNLAFTLLFKRPEILTVPDHELAALVGVFVKAMRGLGPLTGAEQELVARAAAAPRPMHPVLWLRERVRRLEAAAADPRPQPERWGWKEPNTHVVLDRLRAALPSLRYVHVARHGLDMAYSGNQNQLRLWGPLLLSRPVELTPASALEYWCAVHRRVLALAADMGDDFLLMSYDDLCREPREQVARLLDFLGIAVSPPELGRLAGIVVRPRSIGRHAAHGLAGFDPADLAYVERLGFSL
jgi:sulfotransferase family protein